MSQAQHRFIEAFTALKKEGVPYSHQEMRRRLNYRSINAVWELYKRLERDGLIDPGDPTPQLRWTKEPSLTSKGRKALSA